MSALDHRDPGLVTPSNRRMGLWFYVKLVAVPAGLVALLFALGRISADRQASVAPELVLAGAAVFATAAVLAGVRMAVMLRAGGCDIGFSRAITVHYRAMFYHLFTPLGFGLDVAKFAMLRTSCACGTVALATILLLDRVVGIAGLAILSAVMGVLVFGDPVWLAWSGAVAAVLVLGVLGGERLSHLLQEHHARQVRKVSVLIRSRPLVAAATLALTLVIHVTTGLSIWLAAQGSGISLAPSEAIFANASAFLFQVIPLQIAGAGGAEAAGVVIYALLGLGAAHAALLVAIAYGYRLVAALLGGALEAWVSWRRYRHPDRGTG